MPDEPKKDAEHTKAKDPYAERHDAVINMLLKGLNDSRGRDDERDDRKYGRKVQPITPPRLPAKLGPDGALAPEAGGNKAPGVQAQLAAPQPQSSGNKGQPPA